jgi:transcriptional regulator with XRE-family HTH domain
MSDIREKTALLLRVLRGVLSQSKMAKKLGLTQPQISRYENGNNDLSLSRLQSYAESMGFDVQIRLGEDLDPVSWPIPPCHHMPDEASHLLQDLQSASPTKREETYQHLQEYLDGNRSLTDVEVPTSDQHDPEYDLVLDLLDRLFDAEDDKSLATSIWQAKQTLKSALSEKEE